MERKKMERYCDNEEIFAAYIDRTLDEDELRAFEEHLSKCPYCLEQLLVIWNEIKEFNEKETETREKEVTVAKKPYSKTAGSGTRLFDLTGKPRLPAGEGGNGRHRTRLNLVNSGVAALIAALILSALFFNLMTSYRWDPIVVDARHEITRLVNSQNIGSLRLAGYCYEPAPTAAIVRGNSIYSTDTKIEKVKENLLKRTGKDYSYNKNHRLLGDLLLATNQQERALIHYRKAFLDDPEDPELLNNLAVAYFRTGREDSSLKYLLSASKKEDAPIEVFFNLAVIFRNSGNRSEMRRAAERYFSRDPSSVWAEKLNEILTAEDSSHPADH